MSTRSGASAVDATTPVGSAAGAQRVRRHRAHVVAAHPLAANTGPSMQDRVNRVRPSSPTTGSTQVMHTPIPQAIDSSTAT